METLEQKVERLEREIKELRGNDKFPQINDDYYFIDYDYGEIANSYWANDEYDNQRKNFLGIYSTKQEAEAMRDKIRTFIRETNAQNRS